MQSGLYLVRDTGSFSIPLLIFLNNISLHLPSLFYAAFAFFPFFKIFFVLLCIV